MTKTVPRPRAHLVIAAAIALLACLPALAQAQGSAPGSALADGITAGPDGNVWYTEFHARRIGRVTPAGKIKRFPTQTTRGAAAIVTGPDGALWFTQYGDRIGRMTTSGKLTEFRVPFGNYRGIASGPDGRLWFVDKDGDKVLAMTTDGVVSVIPLQTGSTPQEIVTGPDNNLWVTLYSRQAIARVTPAGAVTEFPLPSGAGNPAGITVGPDGALWFTEFSAALIGRVTTDGVVSEFPLQGAPRGGFGIATGPDGALWIAQQTTNRIGRFTTTGAFTEVAVPTARARPIKIVAGPSGVLWFTENGRDKIGQVGPAATASGISPIREFAYDATPPRVRLTVPRSRAGAQPLRVRCSERCSVLAELVAAPAVARRLGVARGRAPVVVGVTRRGLARTRALSVRPSKAAVRKRLAARGRTSLLLRVTVRDAQANPVVIRRSVRL